MFLSTTSKLNLCQMFCIKFDIVEFGAENDIFLKIINNSLAISSYLIVAYYSEIVSLDFSLLRS